MPPSPPTPSPALLALDWGGTQVRAWLLDAGGLPLDTRTAPSGIFSRPQGDFPAILSALTEGWPRALPALACGMIASRDGWREVPYLPAPAGLRELAGAIVALDTGLGFPLHLVPGLVLATPARVDVMRGEETQLLGLPPEVPLQPSLLILPGTHSKWARTEGGRILSWRTFPTGELFALLTRHGSLATLCPPAPDLTPFDENAFTAGVHRGHTLPDPLATLFTLRAEVLTGRRPASSLPAHLSGLLLGREIAEGRAGLATPPSSPGSPLDLAPWIIGEGALASRYAAAFAHLGLPARLLPANPAPHGLWRLARAARLLP